MAEQMQTQMSANLPKSNDPNVRPMGELCTDCASGIPLTNHTTNHTSFNNHTLPLPLLASWCARVLNHFRTIRFVTIPDKMLTSKGLSFYCFLAFLLLNATGFQSSPILPKEVFIGVTPYKTPNETDVQLIMPVVRTILCKWLSSSPFTQPSYIYIYKYISLLCS